MSYLGDLLKWVVVRRRPVVHGMLTSSQELQSSLATTNNYSANLNQIGYVASVGKGDRKLINFIFILFIQPTNKI